MALLGKIDFFNHNSDDICGYIGRTDQCIFANHIDEAKKKKKEKKNAIFLTIIGSDTYSFLRNFLAPVSLSTETVDGLFEIL